MTHSYVPWLIHMAWGSVCCVYWRQTRTRRYVYWIHTPYILSKEPYILSKEPYILSKEPHILSKEPLLKTNENTTSVLSTHNTHSRMTHMNESWHIWMSHALKQSCVMCIEVKREHNECIECIVECMHTPCILSKEPYILSKEPYILSKEPYILSKEPLLKSNENTTSILSTSLCVLNTYSLYPVKRALYLVKRALYLVKRALHLVKQPYILSKEPHILSKEPLYLVKRASIEKSWLTRMMYSKRKDTHS